MDEQVPCVRQATITLPFFDYQVPVLYVEDGTRYIPVIALCEMLGLRAKAYIPRWRKLVLWASAQVAAFFSSHTAMWRTGSGNGKYACPSFSTLSHPSNSKCSSHKGA